MAKHPRHTNPSVEANAAAENGALMRKRLKRLSVTSLSARRPRTNGGSSSRKRGPR